KNYQLPKGSLAVCYDSNLMEAEGYAYAMAEVFKEDVYLVEFCDGDKNPCVRYNKDSVMEIEISEGKWIPIRAVFPFLTVRPWNRLPVVSSKTLLLNPVISALCGGKNKLLASKAYNFLNSELSPFGIRIVIPKT